MMMNNGAPPGWVNVKLGEISEIKYGKGLPTKNLKPTGFPVFGANGVIGYYDEFMYQEAQLLISCRGANSGKINYSPKQCFITNNSLVIEFPTEANQLKNTFFYFLQTANKERLVTGTAQPQVTINNAIEIDLWLPPLDEQKRIVAKIEELFTELEAGIASLQLAQAQLKTYRQALLKHAFEGKLTAQWRAENAGKLEDAQTLLQRIQAERQARYEAEVVAWEANGKEGRKPRPLKELPPLTLAELADLPELPAGWAWTTLDQSYDVSRGRFSIRPRNDPRYYDGVHPFVQIGDLPRDGGNIVQASQTLNDKGLTVSRKFPKGTVLMAIVGATIGNTGVLTFDSCSPDSLVAFQASYQVRLQFLELYLRSKKHEIRSASYASGGQPNINLAFLQPYPIPLPSLTEQECIVAEVEQRLSVVDQLEQDITVALQQAEALRQSILKKAFAGQLVPQDPQDEPASVLLSRIQATKEEAVKTDQAKKNVNKKPTRRKTKRNGA